MYRSPAGNKEQTNRDLALFLIIDKLKSHVIFKIPLLLETFCSTLIHKSPYKWTA